MCKKNITTFLLSENPNGIKKVWVDGKVCNCIYLTRNDLQIAKSRKELSQPALYFLLGEGKKIYIGETTDFNKRIINHNQDKDFWNEVLVFIDGGGQGLLSKSEVQLLEYLAFERVKEANNYTLEANKQYPNKPILPENREEIVKAFFSQVIFLSAFLKYDLLEIYDKKLSLSTAQEPTTQADTVWYLKGKNPSRGKVKSKGVYKGSKFIVLAGSQISKKETPSLSPSLKKTRALIIDDQSDKVLSRDDYFELKSNVDFDSPSAAASFCWGGNLNGWQEWKNEAEQPINILRQGFGETNDSLQ